MASDPTILFGALAALAALFALHLIDPEILELYVGDRALFVATAAVVVATAAVLLLVDFASTSGAGALAAVERPLGGMHEAAQGHGRQPSDS
jgi:hypothetical protein